MTIAELNDRNEQFWGNQTRVDEALISDIGVAKTAYFNVKSEADRGVPFFLTQNYSQALNDAATIKEMVIHGMAVKGGMRAKTDKLQQAILELVRQDSGISLKRLKQLLENHPDFEIDEEIRLLPGDARKISWLDEREQPHDSPVSGLKDRLCRAKNKVKKESR